MSPAEDPRQMIRRLNVAGFALTLALFGGFGGWAATSELTGAVIAPGTIVVESSVKKVQHPTGGVIGEIMVKEGDAVEAGQVLIRLNETLTKASLGIVLSQSEELTARQARLIAERDGAPEITFPEPLVRRKQEPLVAATIAGEISLFQSRRSGNEGQKAQLRERIAQTIEEISGLSAQLSAKEKELKYITEELEGVTDLYQKKLVTVMRFNQLQREEARLGGERGNLISEMARARGRISESELQILQLDQNFKTDVLKDLRDAEGRLSEVKEKVVAAGDQFNRVDIRAPQNGIVHQLTVHTIGGVISPGETVMQIVPGADELVLEGKVEPQDIDQIELGAQVHVRVMAGNQRSTPDLKGVLDRKSPDLTREQQTNHAYYVVRVTFDQAQMQRPGGLKLVPGMPAEAFIRTQERTPLQYLLKPLMDQVARTFRER
jgi:HlyD family secretion protein